MKKIETIEDFKNCLNAEKAVVFIFFEWSGQAHFSKRIVEDWENQNENLFPVFELNPEKTDFAKDWVHEKVKDLRGFGSLVWLNEGNILDFEFDSGKLGIGKIQEKTVKLFH